MIAYLTELLQSETIKIRMKFSLTLLFRILPFLGSRYADTTMLFTEGQALW